MTLEKKKKATTIQANGQVNTTKVNWNKEFSKGT